VIDKVSAASLGCQHTAGSHYSVHAFSIDVQYHLYHFIEFYYLRFLLFVLIKNICAILFHSVDKVLLLLSLQGMVPLDRLAVWHTSTWCTRECQQINLQCGRTMPCAQCSTCHMIAAHHQ
jgi:hypothetical protein